MVQYMCDYAGLHGRDLAIMQIHDKMISNAKTDFLVLGSHGSGKKYVLRGVIQKIENNHQFAVLQFAGDQIVEYGKKYSAVQKDATLSLSVYVGISWSYSENNNNRTNYLVNCLRKVKANHIVFCVADFEECLSEARDVLFVLIKNKEFLEKQLSKSISILITASKSTYFDDTALEQIILPPYSVDDIEEYVERILRFQNDGTELDAKYQKMMEICNSDLNLVNLLYRDLLESDLEYSITLNRLIRQKIGVLKKLGKEQSVNPRDIEEIILTCSLSAECFSRFEISEAAHRPEEIINESFQLSIQEQLIQQVTKNLFDFVSPSIKQALEGEMLSRHNTRLLDYYNYLTKYRTDEYFLRAYYRIRYDEAICEDTLSLLILATEQSTLFNDEWMAEKIARLIETYGDADILEQYSHIAAAYKFHKAEAYAQSNSELDRVDLLYIGAVGQIELTRLAFKNYYLLSQVSSFECSQAFQRLKNDVQMPIVLSPQEGLIFEEEKIFKLRVVYDIAPFALDVENDYVFFQKLYDLIRVLLRQECEKNSRAKTIQYINNVFNRKAFLYANPMAAMPFYEEAKIFFRKNHIWDEYCITLICQAGTCLACHQYTRAINFCTEAQAKIQELQITIPRMEKLNNNLRIAQFLQTEEECTSQEVPEKTALHIARELEGMAVGPACGTKHVLLTNAASLYLYAGELEEYKRVKTAIEKSLGCHDVSNVQDQGINDFYRYHFAWFEMFFQMKQQNWDICTEIMNDLDCFIPALFKKQENLWREKNDAAKQLIQSKTVVNGYQFCKQLVETPHRETDLSRFYHRGLMVSDLQYTSYN